MSKWIIALTLAFAATPCVHAQSPRPVEGHREVQNDPPQVSSVSAQREVSAAAIITRGRFTSVQVNTDINGNNVVGDASNEPSIAVDPTNGNLMAIGWRHFDFITSDFRQAGIGWTNDGGQTWTFPDVLDRGQFRSDPVLASDRNGVFFYSSLSALDSIEVFRSFDGGATWGLPVSAFGGDKQWIAVDRTQGVGSGFLYQAWNVQFTCCGVNDYTRSTDTGASFDGPFAVSPTSLKWGTMDVDPGGRLFIAGVSLGGTNHLVARSSDAQTGVGVPTFDFVTTVNLGGTVSIGGPANPQGLLGQVNIATDHSSGPTQGNVYVVSSVDPPGSDPRDIMFVRSEDGGVTWSAPVRINDDPEGNDVLQWFGTMSVSPTGRIDVVFNDTRTSGDPTLSETYYAFSYDAGRTWSRNEPMTPVFDSTIGWPVQQKMGDYYDMVSDATGASLAYAATFNGEQDVYFVRIDNDCNQNGVADDQDALVPGADCDGNGIPDDCQVDCNSNGAADTCDLLNAVSEDCNANGVPDECDLGFGCQSIRITEDGGSCLETEITLPGVNESGDVTIALRSNPGATLASTSYTNSLLSAVVDMSTLVDGDYVMCATATEVFDGRPDAITFEALNTSCGPGGQYEFFLNGTSLGTAVADPVDGCTCGAAIQSIPIVDVALLGAWNVGGANTLRVLMTGGSENLAWVRARVERGAVSETVCIFDTGSACTDTGLCNHAFVGSPVDALASVAFETLSACRDFAKQGEEKATINIACTLSCGSQPAGPSATAGAIVRNRYLSIVPGNTGVPTSLRVKLVSSADFPGLVGTSWWVGTPTTTCENSGQVAPPVGGCGPAGGGPLTLTTAELGCGEQCADWGAIGVVHLFGEQIVPDATYEVLAVPCGCDPNDPLNTSVSLPLATSRWGDVCGPSAGGVCALGPDNTVDFSNDLLGVLDKFSNLSTGVPKSRADIVAADISNNAVDQTVSIADAVAITDAFRGLVFPFAGPTVCP